MPSPTPELVAIDHDDYHAKYVGTTADDRQFFLTTPFVPGGDEFVALYIFAGDGRLLEALVDRMGPRESMDAGARREVAERQLAGLGPLTFGRIEIAPFSVERFGIEFGLLARDAEGEVTVELEPGNYMAFWEPWDSGEYDT